MKTKDRQAFLKLWAHNPEQGQAILDFGKKYRKENASFKSAMKEIKKLQKAGK